MVSPDSGGHAVADVTLILATRGTDVVVIDQGRAVADVDLARSLTRELLGALDRDHDDTPMPLDVVRAFDRALALDRDLDLVDFDRAAWRAHLICLDLDRALALDPDSRFELAAEIAAELAVVVDRVGAAGRRGNAPAMAASESTRPLGRLARALLTVAVRQLPPGQRDRYTEEWQAECRDQPLQVRWVHGVQVLLRARATARSLHWRPASGLERQHPW